MSVLDDLKQMETLLNGDGRWIKYEEAQDANGKAVLGENPDACCWCLIGAMMRVSKDGEHVDLGRVSDLSNAIYNALGEVPLNRPTLVSFNDAANTTQDDVLALIRKAIEMNEVSQ